MTAETSARPVAAPIVTHSNRETWDTLVAGIGGQPFQSWAWGELKSRFGWQPHRLSSADGTAAAQVLIRPYRGLSVAYVPRGPVLAGGRPPPSDLVEEIIRLARSRRAAFVRFEPDILEGDDEATALDGELRRAGFRTAERTLQPRSSIRLDLRRSPEELLAGLSKGHRADLRRAERDGVSVRFATSEAEVGVLHEMLRATRSRKSFAFHSAAYFRVLWSSFGNAARLLIADLDGAPVAASLVLAWGRHGTYLAAGSTSTGLQHRAAHLLQWNAIGWAMERGAETWDLWGIADARGRLELAVERGAERAAPDMARLEAEAQRDPLDGVYRFKKGWGGDVVRSVPAYDRVFIAPAYWFWQWRRGEA